MTDPTESPGQVAEAQLGATDPTETDDLDALWQAVETAFTTGTALSDGRDEHLWDELESVAKLYAAVTRGKAEPVSEWWTFLDRRGIKPGRDKGRKRLFHPLIQHFTGDDKSKKTAVSRRAALLQYHHDNLLDAADAEVRVEPDELAGWIRDNGGVEGVHQTIIKPPLSDEEKEARKNEREFWAVALAETVLPMAILNGDLQHLKPYADGALRLALVACTDTSVQIIGMVSDDPVTTAWVGNHAKHLIERLPPECRLGLPVEPKDGNDPPDDDDGGDDEPPDDEPPPLPTKRRPGRPRKNATDATAKAAVQPAKRGRPPSAKPLAKRTCQICGRPVTLDDKGLIRAHGYTQSGSVNVRPGRQGGCAGSGQPPGIRCSQLQTICFSRHSCSYNGPRHPRRPATTGRIRPC